MACGELIEVMDREGGVLMSQAATFKSAGRQASPGKQRKDQP